MRRFILGWKVLGYARRFGAEIVNYADDFVVCTKAPAETMRGVVEGMMERMRVPINATKTRCMRAPEEPLEFLGYRIGRNYRRDTGRAYIGTRPSRDSVVSVCRRISELTEARYGLLNPKTVVGRLNRVLYGWANYFQLGQVSPATRRSTRMRSGGCAPAASTRYGPGSTCASRMSAYGMTWASPALRRNREPLGEGMISSESRVRENRTPGSMSGERKRGYGED